MSAFLRKRKRLSPTVRLAWSLVDRQVPEGLEVELEVELAVELQVKLPLLLLR